jgi:hypothetical protein
MGGECALADSLDQRHTSSLASTAGPARREQVSSPTAAAAPVTSTLPATAAVPASTSGEGITDAAATSAASAAAGTAVTDRRADYI